LRKLFDNIKEKNTLIFFFLMLFIFIAAFDPTHAIDKKILNNYDKIKHIGAFFALSLLLFESSIKINKYYKFIILISLAFSIEYIQSMIGREASIKDFLASFSGIVLFIFIKFLTNRFRKNIKRP
jgi:VanZ family protein